MAITENNVPPKNNGLKARRKIGGIANAIWRLSMFNTMNNSRNILNYTTSSCPDLAGVGSSAV